MTPLGRRGTDTLRGFPYCGMVCNLECGAETNTRESHLLSVCSLVYYFRLGAMARYAIRSNGEDILNLARLVIDGVIR